MIKEYERRHENKKTFIKLLDLTMQSDSYLDSFKKDSQFRVVEPSLVGIFLLDTLKRKSIGATGSVE